MIEVIVWLFFESLLCYAYPAEPVQDLYTVHVHVIRFWSPHIESITYCRKANCIGRKCELAIQWCQACDRKTT